MALRKCQQAKKPQSCLLKVQDGQKSGIKKVLDGLELQVCPLESAKRLRARSLALRKFQQA